MLGLDRINAIAADVARTSLPRGAFIEAASRPDEGWQGDDIILVTIVLKDRALKQITGDHALDTLHRLQTQLKANGETRFAVIHWATDAELAADEAA